MGFCRMTQSRIWYDIQIRGTIGELNISTDWSNNAYYFTKHSCIVVTSPRSKNHQLALADK